MVGSKCRFYAVDPNVFPQRARCYDAVLNGIPARQIASDLATENGVWREHDSVRRKSHRPRYMGTIGQLEFHQETTTARAEKSLDVRNLPWLVQYRPRRM